MVGEMKKASEGEHVASKTDLMHREILAIGRETRKSDQEEVECLTVLAEGVLRFCVMPAMQMTMDAYIEAASTATAIVHVMRFILASFWVTRSLIQLLSYQLPGISPLVVAPKRIGADGVFDGWITRDGWIADTKRTLRRLSRNLATERTVSRILHMEMAKRAAEAADAKRGAAAIELAHASLRDSVAVVELALRVMQTFAGDPTDGDKREDDDAAREHRDELFRIASRVRETTGDSEDSEMAARLCRACDRIVTVAEILRAEGSLVPRGDDEVLAPGEQLAGRTAGVVRAIEMSGRLESLARELDASNRYAAEIVRDCDATLNESNFVECGVSTSIPSAQGSPSRKPTAQDSLQSDIEACEQRWMRIHRKADELSKERLESILQLESHVDFLSSCLETKTRELEACFRDTESRDQLHDEIANALKQNIVQLERELRDARHQAMEAAADADADAAHQAERMRTELEALKEDIMMVAAERDEAVVGNRAMSFQLGSLTESLAASEARSAAVQSVDRGEMQAAAILSLEGAICCISELSNEFTEAMQSAHELAEKVRSLEALVESLQDSEHVNHLASMTLALERAETELEERRHEIQKLEDVYGSERQYLREIVSEQEQALSTAQAAHMETMRSHASVIDHMKSQINEANVREERATMESEKREVDLHLRLQEAWVAEEAIRLERDELISRLDPISTSTPDAKDTNAAVTSTSPIDEDGAQSVRPAVSGPSAGGESAWDEDREASSISDAMKEFRRSLDQFNELSRALTAYQRRDMEMATAREQEEEELRAELAQQTEALKRALLHTSSSPTQSQVQAVRQVEGWINHPAQLEHLRPYEGMNEYHGGPGRAIDALDSQKRSLEAFPEGNLEGRSAEVSTMIQRASGLVLFVVLVWSAVILWKLASTRETGDLSVF